MARTFPSPMYVSQTAHFRVYDTSFDLLGFTDIEDITHKTGNFKRFSVLVKMLTAALAQQSDSVFIDLLTFADLVSSRIMKAFAFRCLHIAFLLKLFRKCLSNVVRLVAR